MRNSVGTSVGEKRQEEARRGEKRLHSKLSRLVSRVRAVQSSGGDASRSSKHVYGSRGSV